MELTEGQNSVLFPERESATYMSLYRGEPLVAVTCRAHRYEIRMVGYEAKRAFTGGSFAVTFQILAYMGVN